MEHRCKSYVCLTNNTWVTKDYQQPIHAHTCGMFLPDPSISPQEHEFHLLLERGKRPRVLGFPLKRQVKRDVTLDCTPSENNLPVDYHGIELPVIYGIVRIVPDAVRLCGATPLQDTAPSTMKVLWAVQSYALPGRVHLP
jgi:hypothetical protein